MSGEEKQLESDARFMDVYSRQIGAYGLQTMAKLVKLKVLLFGLRGLGVEVAKNLVLAGPAAVTLVDGKFMVPTDSSSLPRHCWSHCCWPDDDVAIGDLGANFFLTEEDVGKAKASACVTKVRG